MKEELQVELQAAKAKLLNRDPNPFATGSLIDHSNRLPPD